MRKWCALFAVVVAYSQTDAEENFPCDKAQHAAMSVCKLFGDSDPVCTSAHDGLVNRGCRNDPFNKKASDDELGAVQAKTTESVGESFDAVHVKRTLFHCASSKASTTAYATFAAAQTACRASDACHGIYDSGCDATGSYYLCQTRSTWATSASSCVYEKKEGPCYDPESFGLVRHHLYIIKLCRVREV